MAGSATVTGVIGPGVAITTQLFQNVTFFGIDTDNEILHIKYDNGNGAQERQISIAAAATMTVTISGSTYTVTIAN